MDLINYISILLLSYIGLASGMVLALIAKEEILAGTSYFVWLQRVILIAVIAVSGYFLQLPFFIWLIIAALLIITLLQQRIDRNVFFLYCLLSLLFYLNSQNKISFPLAASLIFLEGLPSGALLLDFEKKKYIKIILGNLHFIVLSILMQFISTA
jgi:hypothetical protein